MATDAVLSKYMTISFDGKVIAKCNDFSLEINKETIDITSLSSSGWKEKLVDLKEWSVSANGIVTRGADATNTVYDELLAEIVNSDDTVPIVLTDTHGSGTISISGSAFLTGLSSSVTTGDKVSWSGKIEGTGALTIV